MAYFLMAVAAGLLTRDVNVNRINIIFPALIILTGLGIVRVIRLVQIWIKGRFRAGTALGIVISLGYLFLSVWFLRYYYFIFRSKVGDADYFSSYISALKELDKKDYDILFLTCYTGFKADRQVSEIIAEYACRLDVKYVQGLVDTKGGKNVLPYQERYRFFYSWDVSEQEMLEESGSIGKKAAAVFMVHQGELEYIELEYRILDSPAHSTIWCLPHNKCCLQRTETKRRGKQHTIFYHLKNAMNNACSFQRVQRNAS